MYGHFIILVKTGVSKTNQHEPNVIVARKLNVCEHVINISKKLHIKNTIDWIHFINSSDTGLYLYNTLLLSKDKHGFLKKIRMQYNSVVKVLKIKSSCLQGIPAYLWKLKKHITDLVKEYQSKRKTVQWEMQRHNTKILSTFLDAKQLPFHHCSTNLIEIWRTFVSKNKMCK